MRIALLAFTALLTACASAPEPKACVSNTLQQNQVLEREVTRRFGKAKHGYNTKVEVPRRTDARGHVVLEAYGIYPITLPEPEEPPPGRRLTVVMDPCKLKAVRVFEPAA